MKKLLVIMLLLGLVLGLAEIGLRVAYRLAPPADLHLYPVTDAWLHGFTPRESGIFYRSKANHSQDFVRPEFRTKIRTNAEGFREDFDISELPLDIAIVGDSFAFGWGVNAGERFSDRLRGHFPNKTVASLAYPNGHSPPFYDYFLRANPKYVPKVLVIELFAFNDLSSDQSDVVYLYNDAQEWVGLGSKALAVSDDGFIVSKQNPQIPRLQGWRKIVAHSQLGRTVLRLPSKFKAGTATHAPQKPSTLSALDQGALDANASQTLEHVIALVELLRARGGDALVLYVPFGNRVGIYPSYCQYSPDVCDQMRTDPDGLGASLQDYFDQRGIHMINPVMEFRELEKQGKRLYFDQDAHWTVAGHNAAAKLIAQAIQSDAKLKEILQ